jgi:DNA polymerase elongation subunit (family B)
VSFTRIFYDSYKNRLYCIENIDGKRRKLDFHPKFEYYVADKNSNSGMKDIHGNPVSPQSSDKRAGMKLMSESLKTYETDIPEDVKFLQNRYKGQDIRPDLNNFQICTIDIEVESKYEFPKPDEAKFPINLISVHYSKEDTIYTFGTKEYTGDSPLVKNYHYCPDEKTMMERFIKHFRKKNVDILTGWNIMGFDVPYIVNRCTNLGITLSLSPINIYRDRKNAGYHIEGGGKTIAGISVLDGLELYKNFVYTKRERYSLQFIGKIECGEGKKDLDGSVNDEWERNWNNFVEYNVQDVILCLKIEEEKKHIPLAINFCYQALIPFERIFSSISLITGYMMKYMHEKNIVFPDRPYAKKEGKFPGAYVMAKPGFYKWLMSFDIASMYPHMIMQYNISPETIVMNPEDPQNYIKTPLSEYKTWETSDEGEFNIGGIYYRKDKVGILAQIVSDIYQDRKRFKAKEMIADNIEKGYDISEFNKDLVEEVKTEGESSKYYGSQQLIRKILINSIYGVLGNEYFNFFNINNAIAVTLSGQELIKYLSRTLNEYMKCMWHKIAPSIFPDFKGEWKPLKKDVVVLIDTDSVDGNTFIETNFGKMKIEKLFNKCNEVKEYSNGKFIGKFENNILSNSMNLETNKTEFKKINYVMKHKVKKKMYKIKYKEKEIILTEDHSLMVQRNQKIIEISPKDLQKNDKIIIMI